MEHLISWIHSTDSQEDFSDGQSLSPFTGQWNLKFCNETEAENSIYIEVVPDTSPQVTVTVASPYKSSLVRLAGCIIVSVLPEKSLPEVFESLKNIWQFYTEEPLNSPDCHFLSQKKIEATIIGKDQRRSLVLSE